MSDRYRLEITHRDQVFGFSLDKEVGLGRQLTPSEPIGKVYSHSGSGEDRIAVAPFSEVRVSRRQLLIRPTPAGIAVINPSTNSVFLNGKAELLPNDQHLFASEGRIAFGPDLAYQAHVSLEQQQEFGVHTLPNEPPLPGRSASARPSDVFAELKFAPDQSTTIRNKLASIIEVLQSAAGSSDFFQRAARAVVELIGLDTAQVLFLEDGHWRSTAIHRADTATGPARSASGRLLECMRSDRRTVWSEGAGILSGDFSQTGVLAVVCAPICNNSGEVIGALYGDRQSAMGSPLAIGPAEAKFVEALAYVIAVGIERQTQEKAAAVQRVRFEQFFSRELADQLAANPEILTAKDALVTIAFADIRSFSSISERLGAQLTLQWIQDTLDELTAIVTQHGGVVVDYVGDAIIAMWGAPVEQSDQARRACRAALEMQVALGPLNTRWESQIGCPTELAIGIHTGVAQVGNIGSRRKFKYGALGHTVNLASRVQGATKHLRTSILITKATHDSLGGGLLTRRIGGIHVVNIEQPVEVYELRLLDDDRGRMLCQLYEKALGEFEAQQFRRAARTLGDYIPNYEDDGPSHILLWRAVNWLVQPAESFDAAWKLPGK